MNPSNKIFLQGVTKLEKKYFILLLKVIKRFRSSFLTDLTTHGKDAAIHRLQSTALHTDIANILLSIYRQAGLFGAKLTASELKALANQKAAGFGTNEQWVNDVIDFLKLHLVKFVSQITDTMRQDIVNIFNKAFEEGWSIDEMVKELKRLDLMEARARVIARTETIRAANVGHSVAAGSTPYEVDKKWNSARDHRTRKSHLALNGHTTDEHGTFKVAIYQGEKLMGYDEMLFPGDATAHAANTINCRCRVTYIPKRDAAGRLVMRAQNTARIIPLRNPSTTIPAHQIAAVLKAHAVVKVNSET